MASKPTEAFVMKQIEQLGGWDVAVFERVANAETQTEIAKSYGISQGFLSRLIHKDAERTRAFREAKKAAATIYAEEAMAIADNVPADRDEISKARERVNVRRWLATAWDREQYGDSVPDMNVNILNLGQLHVDALRHRIVEAERPGLLSREVVPELPGPSGDQGTQYGVGTYAENPSPKEMI